ncbi:fluoride efflux transporter CrcB [Roseitranquillus sediminis]|uniref:fluoride efflux transporter CrcB n=1 Tax=Roseitranquillus sediminis TaxID=2809051 RepID=UPI001D0C64CA|nr:fluoride efflux transporter CrcB [Roseitranquillus sediminis]MBM9596350.1 fluoride efflux transporter CrcB [Roseitranquillus sediminis]
MSATLVQIAAGGAAGAVLRYLTGVAALRALGAGFPWGTLVVNVAGSFLMGVCVVWLMTRGLQVLSPLLMSGFLGGFTTFSAFSLDTVSLVERGEPALAALYVVLSVLLSVGALTLGLWLARAAG